MLIYKKLGIGLLLSTLLSASLLQAENINYISQNEITNSSVSIDLESCTTDLESVPYQDEALTTDLEGRAYQEELQEHQKTDLEGIPFKG